LRVTPTIRFCIDCHHHPLPRSQRETEGVLVRFPRCHLIPHVATPPPSLQERDGDGSCSVDVTTRSLDVTTPLPRFKSETEGVFALSTSPPPSLARVTTTIPSCSQTRGGGGFLLSLLATAVTPPPPSPLARKHEVGVGSCSFPLRRPPHHHHHPLSLAHARWGWFSVLFTCDGRYVTNTTPSRSQTRGGGVSGFVFLGTAAISPPPPPLARKCEVGVVTFFLLTITAATPPRLQMRGGGGSLSFCSRQPLPLAHIVYTCN